MPVRAVVPPGTRFGQLVVSGEASSRGGHRHLTCVCACGAEVIVSLSNLRTGNSTSCGCLQRKALADSNRQRAEAGYRQHPLRSIHNGVVRRCVDPKHKDYPRYGGAGVRLYEPWRNRARFIEDVEREIGPRPSLQHTLDRINPRGNYAPGNIRWATWLQQKHNQRRAWRFLSDEEITGIRSMYVPGGVSQQQVAQAFDTTQGEVSRVVNRRGRYARV
jgi:hypothetical protein